MYFRQVPPVSDLERLRVIRETVPRDPDTVEDCCVLLVEECGLSSRTDAEQWLVFLRALGLIATDDGRYYRTDSSVQRTALCSTFRSRIAGAKAVSEWLSKNRSDGKQFEDEQLDRLYAAIEEELPRTVREDGPTVETAQHATGREYVHRVAGWEQKLCGE